MFVLPVQELSIRYDLAEKLDSIIILEQVNGICVFSYAQHIIYLHNDVQIRT